MTARTYRTGLYLSDGDFADPRMGIFAGYDFQGYWPKLIRGRGFSVSISRGKFEGTWEQYYDFRSKEDGLHGGFGALRIEEHNDGTYTFLFGGEILIQARTRLRAQIILHLIYAALTVLHAENILDLDLIDAVALPFPDQDYEDLECFRGRPSVEPRISKLSMPGILDAALIAAIASFRRYRQYALHKLTLSYRTAAIGLMEIHPTYAPRKFGVVADPLIHVRLANAITLAYSAIEELKLEVISTDKQPSRLPDGSWNPAVLKKLEDRLRKSHIDITEDQIWTLRGPPTTIEKKRKPRTTGDKPSWTRGVTRDIYTPIVHAILDASWLRSKVTVHKFSRHSRSLTPYDTINVQALARRLILEHLGCWPPGQQA